MARSPDYWETIALPCRRAPSVRQKLAHPEGDRAKASEAEKGG